MAKKGKEHKHRDGGAGGVGEAGGAGEAEFLAEYNAEEFPRPSLTVDGDAQMGVAGRIRSPEREPGRCRSPHREREDGPERRIP